ncbi:MAG: hypothetical protein ACE5F3_05435 [Mariprofundaceae bacterium]
MRFGQYLGQAVMYALFIVFIGYFASSPAYTFMGSDEALIKLTFSHAGKRKQPCRERSAEELAAMPSHLRKKKDCPRERSPLDVEMKLDGQVIYKATISPSGMSHDLASPVYERIRLPAGEHRLQLRMRDDIHTEGFNYALDEVVALQSAQILVIDFDSEHGKFQME